MHTPGILSFLLLLRCILLWPVTFPRNTQSSFHNYCPSRETLFIYLVTSRVAMQPFVLQVTADAFSLQSTSCGNATSAPTLVINRAEYLFSRGRSLATSSSSSLSGSPTPSPSLSPMPSFSSLSSSSLPNVPGSTQRPPVVSSTFAPPIGASSSVGVHGVLGVLDLISTSYLAVVVLASEVGKVQGTSIRLVDRVRQCLCPVFL